MTPDTKEIVVIIPFMSKEATEKIKQREKELGIPIKIITSDRTLPAYQEVLGNEEEIEAFRSMTADPIGSILAFTDWRRPDSYSSPQYFFKGFLFDVDPVEDMKKIPPLVPDLKGIYHYKPG